MYGILQNKARIIRMVGLKELLSRELTANDIILIDEADETIVIDHDAFAKLSKEVPVMGLTATEGSTGRNESQSLELMLLEKF